MAMVYCRGCGKEIHETAPTCPHCGALQQVVSGTLKSQTVAGLWCGFLGGFGAHRFYLGKTVSGILYLLFCWTYIPALIASVEMLLIAFSSQQTWAAKHNGGTLTPPVHWTIKALAVLVPILIITGILAAIMVPAYEGYTQRAQQFQSLLLAVPIIG